MEEMSLVPLSLRLGLCGGREPLREGEAWAAPPNLTQDLPGVELVSNSRAFSQPDL